jgi:hypothetical protein
MDQIQTEIQKLVDQCQKMAEYLLIHQEGEFYPFGFKIDNQGQISNVGYFDGNDSPSSQKIIDELRKIFAEGIKTSDFIAYSIAYDCKINDGIEMKVNAVAVECFSKINNCQRTYFLPYRKMANNRIDWGTKREN